MTLQPLFANGLKPSTMHDAARSWQLVSLALLTLSACVVGAAKACDNREPTRSTGMGPHYVADVTSDTTLWREGDLGEPLYVRARVIDPCGEPLAGARVQLWHANQDGEHAHDRWRTDTLTDDQGAFSVTTVMPGYAGGIPRHIHIIVSHPQHDELITRLFFKNDPSIEFQDVDDLALRLEEIQRTNTDKSSQPSSKGWIAGYEFVLRPANTQ